MKTRLFIFIAVVALAGCDHSSSQGAAGSSAGVSTSSSANPASTLHIQPGSSYQVSAQQPTNSEQMSMSGEGDQLLHCSDVQYGNPNYSENMDRLAKTARLPNDYYTRYDEDVVGYLCKGDAKSVQDEVDAGFVKQSEVDGIREALGLDKRSDIGMSYGYSRKKFSDMGLCEACADNVAQYYTREPESKCGKLAKQALEGNPRAIDTLQSVPDYCTWRYQ